MQTKSYSKNYFSKTMQFFSLAPNPFFKEHRQSFSKFARSSYLDLTVLSTKFLTNQGFCK